MKKLHLKVAKIENGYLATERITERQTFFPTFFNVDKETFNVTIEVEDQTEQEAKTQVPAWRQNPAINGLLEDYKYVDKKEEFIKKPSNITVTALNAYTKERLLKINLLELREQAGLSRAQAATIMGIPFNSYWVLEKGYSHKKHFSENTRIKLTVLLKYIESFKNIEINEAQNLIKEKEAYKKTVEEKLQEIEKLFKDRKNLTDKSFSLKLTKIREDLGL